jgi:hypothetical protein
MPQPNLGARIRFGKRRNHPQVLDGLREQRRAKTERLDTAMLKRVFLGWLRGERRHCRMVAIPTIEKEDAK